MSFRKVFLVGLCALLLSIFAPLVALAGINNGGFETGNIAGWSIAGQGNARNALFGVTIPHGTRAGYIENTGNGTVEAPQMEIALQLTTGTVTGFVAGTPTRGTVLWQNVLGVSAGETLTFDWNFMSDELDEDPQYDDFAFFSIVGVTSGVNQAFMLASRNSSSFTPGAPVGFDGLTGWSTQAYTFTANDNYRIGFGVMNVTDGGHNSALMLDGIDVPEPASMGVLIVAASGMLRRRSRFQ